MAESSCRRPVATVDAAQFGSWNEWHGVLFEYNNNSNMAARNFFYLDRNLLKLIQNQYGGTLGGPIKKDKLFFFTSWEALRFRQNASAFATVPTEDQRRGDFSARDGALFDPATGTPDGRGRQNGTERGSRKMANDGMISS